MKNKNLIACVLLLMFTYSCIPEGRLAPQPLFYMTAEKNGLRWTPINVKGLRSFTDSVSFTAHTDTLINGSKIKLDSLNLKISFKGNGQYKLTNNQAYYTTYENGIATIYTLDASFDNWLNISSYKNVGQNQVGVNGTFTLKFINPKNLAGIVFSHGILSY